MKLYIMELRTGKTHKRTIKNSGSIRYQAEGRFLVVRDYYSGKICHRFNISKYGSVRYWAE